MAFILLNKPKKPVKAKNIYKEFRINSLSLAEIISRLPKGIDLADTVVSYQYGYDDDIEVLLEYTINEGDEEFAERMKLYESALARYETWFQENKEKIKAEKARRNQIQEEKVVAKALKALQKAQKEFDQVKTKKYPL